MSLKSLSSPLTESLPMEGSFWGLQKSVMGRLWKMREHDFRTSLAISQRYDLPEVLGRIINSRDIDVEAAQDYLSPTLRALMPDPLHLKDMDKATARILKALKDKEPIAVFGDYDVDGATSSALLKRYFRSLGKDITVYIPDRLKEGYGPNAPALKTLAHKGVKVVILVDCGTTSFDVLAYAQEIGLDIIVLDHHTSQTTLPQAVAVVNPNRLDEQSSLTYLCAAGLTFLFLVALQRILREEGWFQSYPEPDLRDFLDLVALGTVCDVMPLVGLNRAFVTQGLKVLHQRKNTGLAALADVGGIEEAASAYHLGFILGPRVNAGGRVGEASLGAELLSTEDRTEARLYAQKLNTYNQERKEIEAEVLEQALQQVTQKELNLKPVIMVSGDNWHPGVIGIVAGRLKELFHKPVCVTSFDEQGVGKGSGRSIAGVSLGSAMHQACHKGLLQAGGGHAMAAGFTVNRGSYISFIQFVEDFLSPHIEQVEPTLKLDGAISLKGITTNFLSKLSRLEPYGMGNPQPRFVIPHVRILFPEIMGESHLRCFLQMEDGHRQKAVAFRCVGMPLGDALLSKDSSLVSVAVTLKLDTWMGRSQPSLIIEDLLRI